MLPNPCQEIKNSKKYQKHLNGWPNSEKERCCLLFVEKQVSCHNLWMESLFSMGTRVSHVLCSFPNLH
jgi:hypothetical protein